MDPEENIHRQSSVLEQTTSSLNNTSEFLGDDQPAANGFDEEQILDEPTRECIILIRDISFTVRRAIVL